MGMRNLHHSTDLCDVGRTDYHIGLMLKKGGIVRISSQVFWCGQDVLCSDDGFQLFQDCRSRHQSSTTAITSISNLMPRSTHEGLLTLEPVCGG